MSERETERESVCVCVTCVDQEKKVKKIWRKKPRYIEKKVLQIQYEKFADSGGSPT